MKFFFLLYLFERDDGPRLPVPALHDDAVGALADAAQHSVVIHDAVGGLSTVMEFTAVFCLGRYWFKMLSFPM